MAKAQQTKFVFVTGGVLSGLGKGITAASLGALFESRGFSVNIQKLDPYLNVDAGTLNPAEHGECFVTVDGAETDLDLGHYERFMDVELTKRSSVMSGRILKRLIEDERAGKYLGKTVQVVPHLTKAIEEEIVKAAKGVDIHIVEIGGTVGDYESPAFFEAIRSLGERVGEERRVYIQVVYAPYLGASAEFKTKPAQNAVRELRSLGIVPDVLVGRSELPPPKEITTKLARTCNVDKDGVVMLHNADTIYRVPIMIHESGVDGFILKKLALDIGYAKLKPWKDLVESATRTNRRKRRIALVAKYMANEDTYFSVVEALNSASWAGRTDLSIEWVDAEKLSKTSVTKLLGEYDGIVVPGGFGSRAIEGKIIAATYAMNNNIPYLGLCLGLQVAVIAAAREKLKLIKANSVEVDPQTNEPVIHIMEEQRDKFGTGGTMRLGNYPCKLAKGSLARSLYGEEVVSERHRHRYEVNNVYRDRLEERGVWFSGVSPDNSLAEIVEIKEHKFFIASQFHPEFSSRPMRPHPMFKGFISAL